MKVRSWPKAILLGAAIAVAVESAVLPLATLAAPDSSTNPQPSIKTSTESYAVNWPNDQNAIKKLRDAINKSMKDTGRERGNAADAEKDNAFDDTYVYAKGGMFSDQGVKFAYDQDETIRLDGYDPSGADPKYNHGADRDIYSSNSKYSDYFAYQATVPCGNHSAQLSVYVALSNKFDDPSKKTFGNTFLRFRKYDDNGEDWIYNKNNFNKIDPACRPDALPNIDTASRLQNVVNYPLLSADEKQQWEGIEAASTVTGSSASSSDEKCAASAFGLGWLLCNIIKVVDDTVVWGFQSFITSMLQIGPYNPNGNAEQTQIYNVWQNIRMLANVLFVLVFMVFIFANTLSLNVDAYTLKKMLPKLVAAAILVQFSYALSVIVVDIGNVLAIGVKGLFDIVVGGTGTSPSDISTFFGALGKVVDLALALGAIALVKGAISGGTLPVVIVVSFAIVVLFALLAIFFTLVVRNLIINLLIIISPLGFLAMVLPSTERFFKMWWQNLVRTVMMYPIIMALFSVAKVLSAASGGAGVKSLVAASFPIIACFLVPATFKWTGGLMSWSAGKIGDLGSKGGRKAADKFRESQFAQEYERQRHEKKAEKRLHRLTQEEPGAVLGRLGRVGQTLHNRRQGLRQRWVTGTLAKGDEQEFQSRVRRQISVLRQQELHRIEELLQGQGVGELGQRLEALAAQGPSKENEAETQAILRLISRKGGLDQTRFLGMASKVFGAGADGGFDLGTAEGRSQAAAFDAAFHDAKDQNFGALQRDNALLLGWSAQRGDKVKLDSNNNTDEVAVSVETGKAVGDMSGSRIGNMTNPGFHTIAKGKIVHADGTETDLKDLVTQEALDNINKTPQLRSNISGANASELFERRSTAEGGNGTADDAATVRAAVEAARINDVQTRARQHLASGGQRTDPQFQALQKIASELGITI